MGYRKSENVVEREIRGERVLVPTPGSEEALESIYVLNETANLIWEQAVGGRSEAEIARQLADEYEVSIEQATRDTQTVLKDLISTGALRLVEENDS